jgi:hypothetical protein
MSWGAAADGSVTIASGADAGPGVGVGVDAGVGVRTGSLASTISSDGGGV